MRGGGDLIFFMHVDKAVLTAYNCLTIHCHPQCTNLLRKGVLGWWEDNLAPLVEMLFQGLSRWAKLLTRVGPMMPVRIKLTVGAHTHTHTKETVLRIP